MSDTTTAKKKKPKQEKPCNCLELTQKALAEQRPGVHLKTELSINFKTGKCRTIGPLLVVAKDGDAPKRVKLPTIVCTFCPFCGKRLDNGE